MENKKTKLIFKPSIARKLCKMGNYICDIKKNRDVENASVFVFENTEKFREDLSKVLEEVAKEQPQE
jgi:hypothetical protein